MDTTGSDQPGHDEAEGYDPVREAEAAVAALADSFLEWITEDIARASAALEEAKASPGDNRAHLQTIFEVMHNVKGQGSSFGYNLLTEIGGSLCEYIRDGDGSADERQLKVIAAHFSGLDFVIEKDIRGDGGDIGRPLIAKINELVSNVPPPK